MADEEFMFGDLFATVRVQDLPASREVVAVERQENGVWRVCGSATANADGIAELGIESSKTSRVYAFAIDHWGEPFTPNKTVAYGDIIRPSVFLGWLYRITAPGALPDEEPMWWNSTPGMPRPVGSAMAQAEMYFQPIAHGPVDIEWEEKGVGDPHWDKVVALLHFDGDLSDATGKAWTANGAHSFNSSDKVFGASSLELSNIGNNSLTCTHDDFKFGLGDFTIEGWFKPQSSSNRSFVHFGNLNLIYTTDGRWAYYAPVGSNLIMAGNVSNTTFSHIALCRSSGIVTLFVNGVKLGTANQSTINMNQGNLTIGWVNSVNPAGGLYEEVRVTKGVARYTENFTPPTEPFPNF